MVYMQMFSHSSIVWHRGTSRRAVLWFIMIFSLMFLPSVLEGQSRSPLTLDQVHDLVGIDAPDSTIAHEIQSRGIAFVPTPAQIEELQAQHAGTETLTALRKFLPPENTLCANFGACMGEGQHAFHDKSWIKALLYFQQAATISPNSSQAWDSVGHSFLALGRTQEAYAAWDKALNLPSGIGLSACMENRHQVCDGGTLRISSNSLARYKGNDKVFEVPLSSVKVVGMIRNISPSSVTFELVANGTKYDFDFFPIVNNCVWSDVLVCPSESQSEQVAIGTYVSQTVRRFTPTEAAGVTVVAPPDSPQLRKPEPRLLRITVRHRHRGGGLAASLALSIPTSVTYCQGILAIHGDIVQFDCTVQDSTTRRCEHGIISPVHSVQYKDGGLRIVGQGGNWDFFGNSDDLRNMHDAIEASILPAH